LSEDKKQQSFKIELLERISILITAAFGFVAALAWNESFKLLFDRMFPDEQEVYVYFIYAGITTIFAVLLIILVARATARAKRKLE